MAEHPPATVWAGPAVPEGAAPSVQWVDPRSTDAVTEQALVAWHELYAASFRLESPDDEPRSLHAELAELRHDAGGGWRNLVGLLKDRDGTVLAALRADLPTLDNLDAADMRVHVRPEHQRRGHGSTLVRAAESRLAAEGRSRLHLNERVPSRPGDGVAGRGEGFAGKLGYELKQRMIRRTLQLARPAGPADPVDPADPARRLADLESACAPYAAGYTLVHWGNRCPDELVEGRVELQQMMSVDAPMGELEIEPEKWDVERFRANETIYDTDYASYCTGAVHLATGRLVGFTQLMRDPAKPRWAFQWDTIVGSDHRGHRLGMLMKIANLRRLLADAPGTEVVETFNDEENRAMSAVNEAMGFVPAGELRTYGKTLAV